LFSFQKDRYVEARDLEKMRNYIEQNMRDAKPTPTEAPPVQQQSEEIIETLSSVS
jgi:hypothetical protein